MSIYRSLMKNLPWEQLAHRSYVVVLFITLVLVYITTFTDCSPFDRYWRITSDPSELSFQYKPGIGNLTLVNLFSEEYVCSSSSADYDNGSSKYSHGFDVDRTAYASAH